MGFSWWWSLWRRRPRALPHVRVVLYTRQGCHLCEDALELLGRERERFGFVLETIDVDTQSELAAKYGECVPVVTVNGKLRFRGRVNPYLLRRLLETEER